MKVDCVALTHTYDPPEPVDIFGWSRGAIAALTLAEKLNTEGCTCRTKCTCTTRDCTSKDGKALFTETTTTFVAVSTIKPVPVRFLGLLDPVNTGGAQMIGTNASTVPSNVQTVFLALSVESTTVGYFIFNTDEPIAECPETKRIIKCYDKTHEQLGWPSHVGGGLENSAKEAGVPFQ